MLSEPRKCNKWAAPPRLADSNDVAPRNPKSLTASATLSGVPDCSNNGVNRCRMTIEFVAMVVGYHTCIKTSSNAFKLVANQSAVDSIVKSALPTGTVIPSGNALILTGK